MTAYVLGNNPGTEQEFIRLFRKQFASSVINNVKIELKGANEEKSVTPPDDAFILILAMNAQATKQETSRIVEMLMETGLIDKIPVTCAVLDERV